MTIALLAILFLVTRLINLLALPIFNDESLYIFMTKKLLADPVNNFFIGFYDGKEPAFFWLLAVFMKFFTDPLLAGRLLSLIAGLVGLFFFFKLAAKILSPRGVIIASLLYLSSPFLLFYQRLGILDSFLVTALTVSLYFLVSLAEKPIASRAILLGLAMGTSLLTKSNALLFLISFLPLVKIPVKRLILPAVIAFCFYSLILFHPQYGQISQKNQIFVASLQELIHSPASLFWQNFKQPVRWLVDYQGLPFILAILLVIKRKPGQLMPWLLMLIFPLLVEAAVAKIFFPRYFLFVLIPLFIILAQGLGKWRLLWQIPIVFIVLLPNLLLDYQILFIPEKANLPAIERWQYISGWPAGYGLQETADYLRQKEAQKVVFEDITATYLGVPYFLSYNKINYEIINFDQEDYAGSYFVFSKMQNVSPDWPLVLEKSFMRPGGEKVSIYRHL